MYKHNNNNVAIILSKEKVSTNLMSSCVLLVSISITKKYNGETRCNNKYTKKKVPIITSTIACGSVNFPHEYNIVQIKELCKYIYNILLSFKLILLSRGASD